MFITDFAPTCLLGLRSDAETKTKKIVNKKPCNSRQFAHTVKLDLLGNNTICSMSHNPCRVRPFPSLGRSFEF
jgi:hypothetical protein